MSKVALPTPTRRTMLAGLAGGAAAVGLASIPAARNRADPDSKRNSFAGKRVPLDQASVEQWQAEVGSTFYAGTEAGAMALKLVSVVALPISGVRPAQLRAQPFEVTFEAVGSAVVPKGDRTYPLRHSAYGDFQLFFNHTGKALKAIFN